jgi:hypothetical protein
MINSVEYIIVLNYRRGHADGWMDGWMGGWVDGWMDGLD